MNHKARSLHLVYLVICIGGFLVVLPYLIPGPHKVTIAAGTEGGTYFELGRQFAQILQNLPNLEEATSIETTGSVANLELLATGNADVAFVMKPALKKASPEVLSKVSILARLYPDVVQIVCSSDIEKLEDLKTKKIFIGSENSGTRIVAERILESIKLSEEGKDYYGDTSVTYREASEKLVRGEIDAGIFVSGIPTAAVQHALKSESLRLFAGLVTGNPGIEGLEKTITIPANFYVDQQNRISTLGTDVFLMCRRDLDSELVEQIVRAGFDNIKEFLNAHTAIADIDIKSAFDFENDGLPKGVGLHQGAKDFIEWKDNRALLILTGAIRGKYYQLGKTIQSLLKPYKIESMVVHTNGSWDNAEMMSKRSGPTLAIMQYDVALSALPGGRATNVYSTEFSLDHGIPQIEGLYRIATLHKERAHIFVHSQKLDLSGSVGSISTGGLIRRIKGQSRNRICVGPKKSGTSLLAQAILEHHDFPPADEVTCNHSVSDMIKHLYDDVKEPIAGGFFVCDVPSKAIDRVLNNPKIHLVSIDPEVRAAITKGLAIEPDTIEPGVYACLPEGEDPIQTIATRAVLVVSDPHSNANVYKITKAIFEGAAFLETPGGKKEMAKDLESIPLHPEAKKYYQKDHLLPAPRTLSVILYEMLTMTWRLLAVLVILVAGYKGVLMYKRDRSGNQIGRRVLAISVEAHEPNSVKDLLEIRREILDRVRYRFWRVGELNKQRWRYLHDLIDDRINESRDNATRSFIDEIRTSVHDSTLDPAVRMEKRDSMEKRLWECFKNGELVASQHEMLLRILRESQSG